MPILIANLDSNALPAAVCNNAAWAIGEIAVRINADMVPYATDALEALVGIINKVPDPPKTLMENTGLALGRLCLACPEIVAPHLGIFAGKL